MLGKRSYRGRTGRRFPAAGLRRVELLPHRERGHDLVRKVAGGTPPSVTCHRGSPLRPPPPKRRARSAHSPTSALAPWRSRCRVGIGVSVEVVHSIRTLPPRDRRQRWRSSPRFSFALLLAIASHRPRAHWDLRDFYRRRDFYTRRKKQGGFSPLTRVRQLSCEECGRRRAGTALEGRVSERERPGRRKARED